MRVFAWSAAFAMSAYVPCGAELPGDVAQLIVGIAPGWDSPRGDLQCFERTPDGWRAASRVIPVLYGKNGLAWGRGVFGVDESGRKKTEGDGRAPAGVFALGTIYGYDATLPDGADFPYLQVTAADAWIDDPRHPQYNQHVRVDPRHAPPWFERQRMRLNDPAYRWLVEIRHNADPPVAGAGSAIFFHIRRGENRPTAGCTTMAENDLEALIRWLRADRHPHYVLLPRSERERTWRAWKLPALPITSELAP